MVIITTTGKVLDNMIITIKLWLNLNTFQKWCIRIHQLFRIIVKTLFC